MVGIPRRRVYGVEYVRQSGLSAGRIDTFSSWRRGDAIRADMRRCDSGAERWSANRDHERRSDCWGLSQNRRDTQIGDVSICAAWVRREAAVCIDALDLRACAIQIATKSGMG